MFEKLYTNFISLNLTNILFHFIYVFKQQKKDLWLLNFSKQNRFISPCTKSRGKMHKIFRKIRCYNMKSEIKMYLSNVVFSIDRQWATFPTSTVKDIINVHYNTSFYPSPLPLVGTFFVDYFDMRRILRSCPDLVGHTALTICYKIAFAWYMLNKLN